MFPSPRLVSSEQHGQCGSGLLRLQVQTTTSPGQLLTPAQGAVAPCPLNLYTPPFHPSALTYPPLPRGPSLSPLRSSLKADHVVWGVIFFFWQGRVTYAACLHSPLGIGCGRGGLAPACEPSYVLSGTAQRPGGWHIIMSKPLALERKRPVVIHTQGPASLNGLAARLCPQLN